MHVHILVINNSNSTHSFSKGQPFFLLFLFLLAQGSLSILASGTWKFEYIEDGGYVKWKFFHKSSTIDKISFLGDSGLNYHMYPCIILIFSYL